MITLDEAVAITDDMFTNYVEPVGLSLMSGEVPQIMFSINRRGTKEKDWLAQVRFKNTLAISVFRCDVYLEDVFRLCRDCRLWLITREVFQVAVLYAMLHPLYQSQYVDFGFDVNIDYESMMASAGRQAYAFMSKHVPIVDLVQPIVLEIFRYHMMIFTNHHEGELHSTRTLRDLQKQYEQIMLEKYRGAYCMARYRKAWTSLVDADGFIVLEKKTAGRTIYSNDRIEDQTDHIL